MKFTTRILARASSSAPRHCALVVSLRTFAFGLAGSFVLAAPFVLASEHPVELDLDRKPRTVTGGNCLIRNVTIHTATKPAFVGDVLVKNGDIAAIGAVEAPAGVLVIDGTGKHLAPGVVDCHSHICVDGDVNEGTVSISAEVQIADVIDPTDLAIYRALAGGVTTARILHGSANAIGGRDEVLKMKWKRTADEMRFPGGPQGIKFALGENPKRSNWGGRGDRFPGSRMGVEAVYYRAFSRAREYMNAWEAFDAAKKRGDDVDPPRRDVRLEVLAGILKHEVLVHSHCYRADEILMLIRASQHFGFQIATLQHVLEGYKVAKEMADAHVGGSTFGDWWSYKIEAYDGIPQNAALMDSAGIVTSLNSDSAEMMRRLYGEAAKSVRYANMDPVRALDLVTLFPAQQLGIGDRIGSIEVGKDADLVLLNGDPLSSLARPEWTMVDGEIEFERRDAFDLAANPPLVKPLIEAADGKPRETNGPVVAIVGATIHPVTSADIEKGTLLMQGGRILAMGKDLATPAGARVVDASGKHVYPGLIALGANVGLLEIASIQATDDQSEGGGNQPDLRASTSINADSAHIGVTRTNGITRTQTAPQGGGPMRGQSAVMRLFGDTWEELVMQDRDMLHIQFPGLANDAKDKKKTNDAVEELKRLFADAKEYGRLGDVATAAHSPAPPFDPRLDALVPFARGEKKVALHAQNAQTILRALEFAKDNGLAAVLYGATEAWKVVDVIAREGVPVVIGPVLDVPDSRFDPYDASYANPAVLARAGVPFAIMANDPENTRNLAFHAAMACAYGLPHEEAVRAITYYPARILGVEKDLGSLAPGKIADVVVTDGDVLEIEARVDTLFIDGVQQDLSNRQTQLYERFKARLERLTKAK
jgi:imidazolonepropionase-like amidohydrolase